MKRVLIKDSLRVGDVALNLLICFLSVKKQMGGTKHSCLLLRILLLVELIRLEMRAGCMCAQANPHKDMLA